MTQRAETDGGKSSFDGSSYSIRPDLAESHSLAWERIAAPGTWLAMKAVAIANDMSPRTMVRMSAPFLREPKDG